MNEPSSPIAFIAPEPSELAPHFPGYDIQHLIATGGMGAVYQAVQRSLDRTVAIKILPKEFCEDPAFHAAFEAEAKAMARLNHPNLIAVYDFGEVEGMLFIMMEFVAGKSVYHSAHGQAIDPQEVIRLVTGICNGLAHAHENGILHRDIKPSNILLTPQVEPKIGDFGLARPVERKTQDGEAIFGTPGYTAPEVMSAPETVDHRADLFSVGVLLHELLTGKLPSADPRRASQIAGCDARFDAIIQRATQEHPTGRYSSATEIAAALQAITAVKSPASIVATSGPVKKTTPRATHPLLAPTGKAKRKAKDLTWIVPMLAIPFMAFCWYQFINMKPQIVIEKSPAVETEPASPPEKNIPAPTVTAHPPQPVESQASPPVPMIPDRQLVGDASLDSGGAPGTKHVIKLPGGEEMTFSYCPPGDFMLRHPVRLTQGFWLATSETTQNQWQAVMGSNPSHFKGGNLPVENVSWNDVNQFFVKLNSASGLPAGWKWSLPTEAQWVYACRAGTTTEFSFGEALSSRDANFDGRKPYGGAPEGPHLGETTAVGSYAANGWGMYDMHGNVQEWCADWYESGVDGLKGNDPSGPLIGKARVFRGGAFGSPASTCRLGYRSRFPASSRHNWLGFRSALVLTINNNHESIVDTQPTSVSRPQGIPADAKFFNGKWYRVEEVRVSWKEAVEKCKSLGGQLVIIPDDATHGFVRNLLAGKSCWLGATDESKEGQWKWIDGTEMQYRAFDSSQPDNNNGNENCLVLQSSSGRWFDAHGNRSNVHPHICEWPDKPVDLVSAKQTILAGGDSQKKEPGTSTELPKPGSVISSDFEKDADGWSGINSDNEGENFSHREGGSTSASKGYVSVVEKKGDGKKSFFAAPSKFLGDKRWAFLGQIKLRLKQSATTKTWTDYPLVVLKSKGRELNFKITETPSSKDWTSFDIPIHENSKWIDIKTGAKATKEDLLQVLGELEGLWVLAEYSTNGDDRADLDDFMMIPSGDTAVASTSGAAPPTSAASKQTGGEAGVLPDIVGTWKYSETVQLEFRADKTILSNSKPAGKWSRRDKITEYFIVLSNKSEHIGTLDKYKRTLTITCRARGVGQTSERIDDGPTKNPNAPNQRAAWGMECADLALEIENRRKDVEANKTEAASLWARHHKARAAGRSSSWSIAAERIEARIPYQQERIEKTLGRLADLKSKLGEN